MPHPNLPPLPSNQLENQPASLPRNWRRWTFPDGKSASFAVDSRSFMNDEQIAAVIDPIYREKVLRARRAPLSKKMGWGPELFREARGRMLSGIRAQFPDANSEKVERILQERLRRLTEIEE
jgi:hypothetical protein